MKKRFWSLLLCALCAALLLAGCAGGGQDEATRVSQATGIDAAEGEVAASVDNHGGFHGDGSTYIEIRFEEEAGERLLKSLRENANWRTLPLSENLHTAIYGKTSGNVTFSSLVESPGQGIPAIPGIDNGYFFFEDRSSQSEDPKDDAELLNRYSYNFTTAIYDADEAVLYYFEMDT